MSKPLSLHPRYGVNPTLGVCFWCGGDDGTIGLLGFNKGKEAKKHTLLSLEPCPKCKANMALGITVIEATPYQRDPWQPEVMPGAFLTGRWCVVKEDAEFWGSVKEPTRSQIMESKRFLLEPNLYAALGFAQAGDKKALSS